MPRQITWSFHSKTGNWNTSFQADGITDYLNFLSNYLDINFVRVNSGGRVKFILDRLGNNIAAATRRGTFDCRINVNFNFNIGPSSRVLCAYVAVHEFGHMALPGGYKGSAHSRSLGLMSPNCDMPSGNLYEADWPWFRAYPRKPGAPLPWQEPGRFKAAFMPKTMMATEMDRIEMPQVEFGCDHEPAKRPWYDIRPASWLRP